MAQGQCLKCKKQVEISNGEIVPTKNNRRMLKGTCPDCGRVVCRMLGKEDN